MPVAKYRALFLTYEWFALGIFASERKQTREGVDCPVCIKFKY